MQGVSLQEASFKTEYHRALTNIRKNSKHILKKLRKELQKDGDVGVIDNDEPLPTTVKIPILKKM
jgi:hypothetical protein